MSAVTLPSGEVIPWEQCLTENPAVKPNRNFVEVASTLTFHETANPRYRAGAEAHAKLLQRLSWTTQASWHACVGSDSNVPVALYQSLPLHEEGWHAGDRTGNRTSLSIEIAINPETDIITAYAAATLWYRHLVEAGYCRQGVKQHFDWSGKNCPMLLRGARWDDVFGHLINPQNGAAPKTAKAHDSLVKGRMPITWADVKGVCLAGSDDEALSALEAWPGIDSRAPAPAPPLRPWSPATPTIPKAAEPSGVADAAERLASARGHLRAALRLLGE